MRVSVTGRHVSITESMDNYAREKVEKLPKYYDRIQSIEVIVELESGQSRVEVIVEADHRHTFVARESDADMYAAVDLVIDKIAGQLKRHKEKYRNRKHQPKRPDKVEEE